MSNITVQGLENLMSQLSAAQKQEVVERGLLRAGNKVRNKAVLLCPVDTGALRGSIHAEKVAPLTVSVGTNLEYAPYVEYGTGSLGDPSVPHTAKQTWRYQDEDGNWHISHGMQAQPFLRPAVNKQEIRNTIATTITEVLNAGP